jgi:tRNA_anti-like
MKKSYIVIILLIILSVVWIVFRMYNKPHRDPSSETSIKISSTELFRSYENDEATANGLYLDKVLEVSGKITEITTNQELIPIVVLETENPMFGVRFTMGNTVLNAKPGDSVTIRGICTGYLSDVIIIKAALVE